MILYAAQHIDADWYCRLEIDSVFVVENLLRYVQKHRLHPDDESYFLGRMYFSWMHDLEYFADVGFCLPRGALFRLARFCPRHPWRTFAAQVSRPAFRTSALWWMMALTTFPPAPWIKFIPSLVGVEFRKARTQSCTPEVGDVRLVLAESRNPAA